MPGIDLAKQVIAIYRPLFFETTLKGRKTLATLIILTTDRMGKPASTIAMIEKNTTVKSSIFQGLRMYPT